MRNWRLSEVRNGFSIFLELFLILRWFAVKHKEKVYENDSLKLKLDQAAEFKIKIMESQAALKKELEQVKKEKEEAVQAHEDLSDISDALEMATLDKEMAEEKVIFLLARDISYILF